jgi:outer membrane protein assembly factor BamB
VGDYVGASPVVRRDRVYVAAETDRPSGTLAVLDLDGRIVARDPRLQSHPHSSPAIDEATGIVVVGDNTGNLTAWATDDPSGLRFLWVFNTRPDSAGYNDIKGPIAVADGGAFFGAWDRKVRRVDLATGEEVWSYRVPGFVMSGAAIADGTVYIGSHDHHVYALDADDGHLRWSYLAGGRIYVGSHDGYLHCLDAARGDELWRHWVGGFVTGTPVLAGPGIVVASRLSPTNTGDLVMVRAE